MRLLQEFLPRDNGDFTVAPGHYTFVHGGFATPVNVDDYAASTAALPFYIVAHAALTDSSN